MSEFNIERLRSAVDWAVRESEKEFNRAWDQGAWMKGVPGTRVRKVKSIRFVDTVDTEIQMYGQAKQVRQVKCGSSYCVAGHVCADEGDAFITFSGFVENDGSIFADTVLPKGSTEAVDVSTRARELLGITRDEAHRLFAGSNTIGYVVLIAKEIARNHGEEL